MPVTDPSFIARQTAILARIEKLFTSAKTNLSGDELITTTSTLTKAFAATKDCGLVPDPATANQQLEAVAALIGEAESAFQSHTSR